MHRGTEYLKVGDVIVTCLEHIGTGNASEALNCLRSVTSGITCNTTRGNIASYIYLQRGITETRLRVLLEVGDDAMAEAVLLLLVNIFGGPCSLDLKLNFAKDLGLMKAMAYVAIYNPSAATRGFGISGDSHRWNVFFYLLDMFPLGELPSIIASDERLRNAAIQYVSAASAISTANQPFKITLLQCRAISHLLMIRSVRIALQNAPVPQFIGRACKDAALQTLSPAEAEIVVSSLLILAIEAKREYLFNKEVVDAVGLCENMNASRTMAQNVGYVVRLLQEPNLFSGPPVTSKRLKHNVLSVQCLQCEHSNYGSRAFILCGACRMVRYCKRRCQEDHWKVHKFVCV